MSAYYPVFLDLRGQRAVVIGSSEGAAAKADALREAGADVVLLSTYSPGCLRGARLAIDTIGVPEVREEASREGVLLNVMDRATACDFIAAAVVKRGALQLAISTSGESPTLAAALKRRLEVELGSEWGEFTRLIGNVRRQLRRKHVSLHAQKAVYQALIASTVVDLLREGAIAGARRQARAIVRQTLATHAAARL